MLTVKLIKILLLLCLLPYLNGCAVALVGAAATGTAATAAIDRRTTGTIIEDQAIELKASQALSTNAALKEQAHINVTSYNTLVLLTGETPTEALRESALALVRQVDKVSHIYNEIKIAAPSSITSRANDTYITSKVKTQLLANKTISGLEIKVVTEDGIVYLMGIVTRDEAKIATDIARQTGGVEKVVRLFQYKDN